MPKLPAPLTAHEVGDRILEVRGLRVMLDSDLADLYGVETKTLNQAVSRNPERFPKDFCFRLTNQEVEHQKSQNVTFGYRRRSNPRAFTQEGVAMLSSVLRSKRAAQVNVAIMRAFVQMRDLLSARRELASRLEELETELAAVGTKTKQHEQLLTAVFEVLEQLTTPPSGKKKRRIGF